MEIGVICFFGTAALCNQIGGVEDEAPTIKLEISKGPLFSEEDEVCYYEIEAKVTGKPDPDIEFTLDDNVSLLSSEKARVSLDNSEDTYTLTTVATNSEGSAKASINLAWGCEEEVIGEEDIEGGEEETDEEGEDGEDGSQEDEEEVIEGDPEPPELSIYIHDGPFYSAADDTCYYVIASEMYGNPYPELTWSRNDGYSLSEGMAQVYLSREETYTLTATATNSEGTATDTITLSWGYDGEEVADDGIVDIIPPEDEDEGSAGYSEGVRSISPILELSGKIRSDGYVVSCNRTRDFLIGDTGNNGDYWKSYVSFFVGDLEGKNVLDAEINILSFFELGDPSFASYINVKAFNYGTLDSSDFRVGGTLLTRIPIGSSSFDITGSTLIDQIQEVLDDPDRNYFQIKLGLSIATDNDDEGDIKLIPPENIGLYIHYAD